jgi:hypothetical protein
MASELWEALDRKYAESDAGRELYVNDQYHEYRMVDDHSIVALYGLKQAPKQWHEKFDRTLTSADFVVNEADTCVYYRFGGGKRVILCLYVNGILIFGTSIDVINDVKSFLCQSFDMKDLGEADVILNIKLIKGENEIILKQSHYVENILKRFGYSDFKASLTPYGPSLKLRKNRGQ